MENSIKILALIFLVSFVSIKNINAQNSGELDNSFGTAGTFISSFGNTYEQASGLLIQPDQKIVLGGKASSQGIYYPALIRLNTDGSMDNSFGTNGTAFGDVQYILWQDETEPLAIQEDGKLLYIFLSSLGGVHNDIAITRFNEDGSIDTDFANAGTFIKSIFPANHSVLSVVVQQDGKILLGGSVANGFDANTQLFLMRLTQDGELDTTFSNIGIFLFDLTNSSDIVTDMKLQSDGKIVALANCTFTGTTNSDPVLLRLNEDGTLDETFGNEGISIYSVSNDNDYGRCLQITDAGKMIIGGQVLTAGEVDVLLIGVTENGELDASFGTNGGISITVEENFKDQFRSMALTSDGKILLTGTHEDAQLNLDGMVMRYTANGLIDTDFGIGGQALIQANSYRSEQIKLQADGKIVIAGWYNVVSNNHEYVCSRLFDEGSNGFIKVPIGSELITLFPNPASDILNVELKKELICENVKIAISDISGKVVWQSQSSSFQQMQINTSQLPNGAYSVSIVGKGVDIFERFNVVK